MVHNITNHNNMNHSSFYGNLCPGLLPVHTCVAELNELNSPMPEEGGGENPSFSNNYIGEDRYKLTLSILKIY